MSVYELGLSASSFHIATFRGSMYNTRGPPKIFDVQFFQLFEKQAPKMAFWDFANGALHKLRHHF